LGDPFASNLEAFPWLNLQISMGVDRVEREEKGGRASRFGREELVKDRGERRKER
jgi:hypothetical protein